MLFTSVILYINILNLLESTCALIFKIIKISFDSTDHHQSESKTRFLLCHVTDEALRTDAFIISLYLNNQSTSSHDLFHTRLTSLTNRNDRRQMTTENG